MLRTSAPRRLRRFRPTLEHLEAKLLPATVMWNVDSDGFWDVGSNWDTGSVPQSGDEVIVDRPAGDFTVTFRQGSTTLRRLTGSEALVISGGSLAINNADPQETSQLDGTLTQTGGTLTGTAVVNVTGLFTWNGGTQSGSGRTNANGGMLIGGATVKRLDRRTLEHTGTATWQDTGEIAGSNGSIWINPAGSTIDLTGNAGLAYDFSGSITVLRNEGTFRKSGGVGASNFFVNLQNDGHIQVQVGTLELGAESTTTGQLSVAQGATVHFQDGTHTFAETSLIDGPGTMQVSVDGTNVIVAGLYNVGGTRILGGRLTLDGESSTADGELTEGVLAGSGLFTLSGAFTWSGGTMTGTGVTALSVAGTLTIGGERNKTLAQRSLDLGGTTRWMGAGEVFLRDGGTINNLKGGSFFAENDSEMSYFAGPTPAFNNAGLFRKTVGTGRTWFSTGVSFNNAGQVEVETGTLSVSAGESSGLFTVAENAILNFTTLVHNLSETSRVTGQGTVRFTGGETNFGGAYDVQNTVMVLGVADYSQNFSVQNLTLQGGVLRGTADFIILGNMTWFGGTLAGPGATRIDAAGSLNLAGAAMPLMGRNINHYGAASWTGGGTLSTTGAPVITVFDGATFEAYGDGTVTGDASFDNQGTFLKSGGDGATTFAAGTVFGSSGYVQVSAGRLSLLGGFTNFATQTLSGGAFYLVGVLQFVGADVRTNEASVTLSGPGAGIVNQGGGDGLANFRTNTGYFRLEEGRNLTVAAFTNSGELSVQAPSVFTATGLFSWTGGTLSGSGDLRANAGLELNAEAGLYLAELQVTAGGASAWRAGDLVGDAGARLTVAANGTFSILIDSNFWHGGTGDPVRVVNLGTVRRAATAGTATFAGGVEFTNTGMLAVESGTLALLGGLTNFNAETGTLAGGTYTLTGVLQFAGAAVTTNEAAITLIGAAARVENELTANGFRTLAANAAAGQLTLQAGARLTTAAAAFTNSGQITLNGADTLFTATGSTMTNAATGRLTLQAGAAFTSSAATLTNNGQVTLTGTGTAFTAASGDLATGGTGSAFTMNAGTIVQVGSFRLVSAAATLTNAALTAGTVTVQAGTFNASGTITGAVTVQGGTMSSTATIQGSVTVTGGTLTSSTTINGNVAIENGTFNGSGIINGSVILSGGRVNVGGNAVGTLRVNGNWTQSGGVLQIQLRADNALDRLEVRDRATLGGQLEVRLLNSYDPPFDFPFDFLTAAAVSQFFGSISPPAGMTFRVEYGELGAALVREE